MKQVYPALIINTQDNSEHPYLITVPDLDIFTEGNSFADVIEMGRDAIGLAGISLEDKGKALPVPSDKDDILAKAKEDTSIVDFSKGTLTYIDVNFDEYRKKLDTRTVRKNVSLPSWLNYEAEKAGENVSKILQDALIATLHVSRK